MNKHSDAYMGQHWREHLFSRDEARVREIDRLVELQHWREILDQADALTDWSTRLANHFRERKDGFLTTAAYCHLDGWWAGVLARAEAERKRQLTPNPPRKGIKLQRRDPATWTPEERERFAAQGAQP